MNANVPRDLETICLKGLRKEPEHRYSSASALANDLRRFLQGRPIAARPLGWGVRLLRWGRRNPAAAALVAMALALVGLALGGGLWLERQQAERRAEAARQEGRESQAFEAVLTQAADLQQQGRWPEARAALDGAPSLLGASAPAGLRDRVGQARADAEMAAELEEIRMRLSETRRGSESISPAELYAEAFRTYGITLMLQPAEAAARVRRSAIRETLLASLHDWFYWVAVENRDSLREMLDQADENEWRRAFREALAARDAGKLKELATSAEAADQPPVVLSGLGGTLLAGGQREEALALLSEAQQRHPGDYWINYLLGHYWDEERPQLAVGYFRATVALRPSSDQAYTMLGRALRKSGDVDGAIAAFRKAITVNRNCPAIRDLASVMATRGGLEPTRVVWERILEGSPPDYDAWYGYAQLCAFLGNEEAYHRACKALVEHFGDGTQHWTITERTSLACLLLPTSGD